MKTLAKVFAQPELGQFEWKAAKQKANLEREFVWHAPALRKSRHELFVWCFSSKH